MQSPQQPNSPHKYRGLSSLISLAVLTGLSIFIWLNIQYLSDTFRFLTYQPPATVSTIVNRSALSEAGTFALYSAQPSIEGSASFNDKCGRQEQNTAILGCYTNGRIYVYDITDSRLDGIKEVTASHEMLHAVYQRLSSDEKSKIDALVEAEYAKLSNNPDFSVRMAFYARTEPGERDNELHSIIGTEISDISPELESHYAKFFTDRTKILDLFKGYNAAFTTLDAQKNSLKSQLDTLGDKIKSDSDTYNADAKSLDAAIESFNKRAGAGDFASRAAFDTEQQELRQRVQAVNDLRLVINNQIDMYETLRQQYNEAITQTEELYKSIDSNLSPAPKV